VAVDVEAEQYHGIAVFSSPENITLRPGEESELSVSMGNTGNGADTYALVLPRTDLALDAPALTIPLEAFSWRNMTLSIAVPAGYKQSKERLQFRVESPDAGQIVFWVDVKVVRPDISISPAGIIVQPAAPVDGQAVNITLTVKNAGTAPSGKVTLTLAEAGTAVSVRTLDDIAPGQNATVVFAWNASAGSRRLSISAESGYADPTPADSSASFSVDVSPRPVHRPPVVTTAGPPVALAAAAAVATATVAGIGLALYTRRRRAV
jgi:uncharacterized membrane protein